MAEDELVEELLSLWQREAEQGLNLTVADLCPDRPELAAELERRIGALRQMKGLQKAAAQTLTFGLLDSRVDGFPSQQLCPVVPGHEVLGELGRGGMGVVYRARQVKLGRVVALKMILSGAHAGKADLARFRTEAEAIARLQHPNIVQIYEVGEHEGRPFFSMEFCPSGSLEKRLGGTPLPPKEAAALVETLARAMQKAHDKGVIHRDLKPGNVLLAEDGTPKITDFGLAKKLDEAGQTMTGAVMGTPPYMAPEQAGRRTGPAGPAVDVYALGAILYECLAGRPPFKAASTIDTIMQVLSHEPVPPRQLQPRTPRDLETVCLKCLQKEPAKRYTSAQALAEDLRRFQAGEPIHARPVGPMERGWRWCRRNRAVAASLLAVVLTLVGGSMVSVVFGLRAEQARLDEAKRARNESAAKQDAEQARRDAQRQLIDLCVASGLTAAREQDHSLALLWFAQAVRLAKDEPDLEEINRIRFANWLRHVCLPEGTFAIAGFRQILDRFRTLRFSPDGRYLLVVASTGDCLVWDRTNGYLASLPGSAERTTAAAWQPDAGWLALAENNGPIRILAPPDFLQLDEVSASGEINALAFSPDGKRMAWGGADGARVWDFETKSHITPPLAHGAPVNALSFSMRGELLATAARDAKARVFRVPNDGSEPIFPPVPHVMRETSETSHLGSDVVAPRFATDDTVLLTLDEPQGFPDRRTLVWRSALTGVPMPESPAREFVGLCSFAVSLGGKYVAALGDVKGRLWDARSQKVLSAIPGPPAFAWNEHVAFSDDGETLITCAHDTRARLYSVADD